ncbi:LLM class flavin-dependent oxidoreductase [Streptomyces sp. NPDC005728]|uniref:LLM class flavin-dependent oxidoreductase n=1 Tax=Streptomyces sp. NPDC005728 TaxID=3157054 RepID=UPI0033D9A22E
MQLVLSENWTLTSGRDLPTLVRWAREAEDAGFDSVMISEHIVLDPDAGAKGLMPNPREYALPGNQAPFTPWPNSLLLLASIASVTTRLRLAAAATLAPLRHPLLLARKLGTLDLLSEGRLIVLPTVSWSRDEYAALGVPFDKRGQLLDEHLEIWELLWREIPRDVRGEALPLPERLLRTRGPPPNGPRIWFGGSRMHDALTRRLVRHGHGFNPLGRPTSEDMDS